MGLTWKTVEQVYKETPSIKAADAIHEMFPGPVGLWCVYYVVVSWAHMIDRCVVLTHGPSGCLTAARTFLSQHYQEHFGNPFTHCFSDVITADTIILGGEESLTEAILQVDNDLKPKLILIINTCATDMIMDDIKGIARKLQPKVKAKLHPIEGAGYKSCMLDNRITAIKPFAELWEPPKEIKKGYVNLLGNYKEAHGGPGHKNKFEDILYPADSDELQRIVEGMGLKVHRVLMGALDYDELVTTPEAEINAQVCCSWGYPLSWEMEKMFGTPWTKHNRPIGIEATKRWMDELAGAVGVKQQSDKFFNEEYKKIKDVSDACKKICKGKVAIIEAIRNALFANTRPMALARFAIEMGMTPYIINMHPLNLTGEYYATDYFIEDGYGDVKMIYDPYPWAKPFNVDVVIDDLGVSPAEAIYFPMDVFRHCKAPENDPSVVARFDGEQPFRRVRQAARGDGFTGAFATMRDIIAGVKGATRKKKKPTLMGRVYGKGFDFEIAGSDESEVKGHDEIKQGICLKGIR